MMTGRHWAGLLAVLLVAGATDLARAEQSSKTTTVTLTIDGMT
jgi:hypothetical protein